MLNGSESMSNRGQTMQICAAPESRVRPFTASPKPNDARDPRHRGGIRVVVGCQRPRKCAVLPGRCYKARRTDAFIMGERGDGRRIRDQFAPFGDIPGVVRGVEPEIHAGNARERPLMAMARARRGRVCDGKACLTDREADGRCVRRPTIPTLRPKSQRGMSFCQIGRHVKIGPATLTVQPRTR
jgi:hypothetical protein